jgi:hypothetical protein
MAAAAPTDAVRRGYGPTPGASSSSMAPLLTSSRSRTRVRWPEELASAVHRVRASSSSLAKASDLRDAMAEARQRRPRPVRGSCWEDCLPPSRPLCEVCHYRLHRGLSSRAHSGRHGLRCGFACLDFSADGQEHLARCARGRVRPTVLDLDRHDSFLPARPSRPTISRPAWLRRWPSSRQVSRPAGRWD